MQTLGGSPRNYKRVAQRQLSIAFLSGVSLTLLFTAWFRNPGWNAGLQHITSLGPMTQWQEPPMMPWEPVLNASQLRRGLSFYGSGARIERVAAKLLAGQPIVAVTLGGSVTRGAGASNSSRNYPSRFFDFIRATFPHKDHVLLNKGIGGTTSGIFSVCAEALVPPDADLLVLEFTFNEAADQPYTSPSRRGFEQLLRKLLRLRNSPAVLLLHHYAWYFAFGDGVPAGLFYRQAEEQLGTLAQYYDIPSPSVRNALYSSMRAEEEPFKVSRVRSAGRLDSREKPIRAAGIKSRKQYFYHDNIHPSDTGHQVMAELLAGVLLTAARLVAAPLAGAEQLEGGQLASAAAEHLAAANSSFPLPPPMIPGNVENPTTLCAMQESFKPMASKLRGFSYRAEKPSAATFVEQKWGYSGDGVGAWMELTVSTQEGPGSQGDATLHLGYLRSYQGMGTADVTCRSGCTCKRSRMDGLWQARVSLMQMHSFAVSQHPECVLRVTVVERGPDAPGGKQPPGAGHRFQLSAIMVAHTPMVLSTYFQQAEDALSAMAL